MPFASWVPAFTWPSSLLQQYNPRASRQQDEHETDSILASEAPAPYPYTNLSDYGFAPNKAAAAEDGSTCPNCGKLRQLQLRVAVQCPASVVCKTCGQPLVTTDEENDVEQLGVRVKTTFLEDVAGWKPDAERLRQPLPPEIKKPSILRILQGTNTFYEILQDALNNRQRDVLGEDYVGYGLDSCVVGDSNGAPLSECMKLFCSSSESTDLQRQAECLTNRYRDVHTGSMGHFIMVILPDGDANGSLFNGKLTEFLKGKGVNNKRMRFFSLNEFKEKYLPGST